MEAGIDSDFIVLIVAAIISTAARLKLKRELADDPVREMCITMVVFLVLHLLRSFSEMQSAGSQVVISVSQFIFIFAFAIGIEKK